MQSNQQTMPNRHTMALITFLVLVPLVYFIPDAIAHYVTSDKLLNVVLSVASIVVILSYLIMPTILKLIKKRT